MNVQQMKALVDDGIPHYFAPDTMRFFDSRIPDHKPRFTVDGRVVFITSERFSSETPRLYTVRVYDPAEESMDKDAKGFQGYETLDDAIEGLNAYTAPRE
jgi:hypothetical protein